MIVTVKRFGSSAWTHFTPLLISPPFYWLTASTASTNSLPLIHLSTREIQEKWDEWAKKKEANKTSDVACIFCLTHVSSSQWDASCDINILTLDNCNGVCRSTRESQFDSIFCVIYKTLETLVLTLEVYEYKIFICFLRMDGSIQRFVRCSFSSSGDLLTRLLCSHLSQFRSGTSATTTWISSPLRRPRRKNSRSKINFSSNKPETTFQTNCPNLRNSCELLRAQNTSELH